MPPKVEGIRDVLFLDGIYLSRKACVLICCDEKHVLGWYLCRYEHAEAWIALMKRIAEPRMVVSDGGTGFAKALKKIWPKAKHQRCVFHVFCQVKRYTTSRPNTAASAELYMLAKELLRIKNKKESKMWIASISSLTSVAKAVVERERSIIKARIIESSFFILTSVESKMWFCESHYYINSLECPLFLVY